MALSVGFRDCLGVAFFKCECSLNMYLKGLILCNLWSNRILMSFYFHIQPHFRNQWSVRSAVLLWLVDLLYGPIFPCVQTVEEEARPNIIPIHTNGARKGPAQYPVWGQTNIRGQSAEEWTKLPSEERWSILMRNRAVSEDEGHFGTFVRDIWWTR